MIVHARRVLATLGSILFAFLGSAAAQPAPVTPAGLSDLTVVSTRVDDGRVTAVIANRGRVAPDLRTTATLFITEPGKPVRSVNAVTAAMGPGRSVEVTFDAVLPPGTRYQVMADSDRRLRESDETNNRTLNQTVPIPPGRVTVDPLLGRETRAFSVRPLKDGQPRPVGVARTPSGDMIPFVENELMLTTKDPAQAEALAARHGGKVVREIKRPAATGRGSTFVVRINTAVAPPDVFGPEEDGFVFSSEGSRNLLAIAKRERQAGTPVGINLIPQSQGYFEKKTVEGAGNDGLSFDYMQTGGIYDVDVAGAWKALFQAGKTGSKPILIGIIDNGFDISRPDFIEQDFDAPIALGTGGPNPGACTGGSPCPWHGTNVSEAAAGRPDDKRGTAGTGGPVARIIAVDRGSSNDDMLAGVWFAVEKGANIINMSFTGESPRNDSWFEGAWSGFLEDFEDDTVFINNSMGRLLFAAAGNDGENIDATNSDGDEAVWYWPCENQAVRCVGGWKDSLATDSSGKVIEDDNRGKVRAPGSNFSTGGGEVIDIWGPWCVLVGDDFDNQGPNVVVPKCGTSLASPMVAGVAALIWAANPQLNNSQVWDILFKNAIQGGPMVRRVHAYSAVREALMTTGVNAPPAVQIVSPAEGSADTQGTTEFRFNAYDVEDEGKCCAATWSVDGKTIGNGNFLKRSMADFPLGSKNVTVSITDSAGATATASVLATLGNHPPTVHITSVPAAAMTQGLNAPFKAEVLDDSTELGLPIAEACPKVKWTSSKESGVLANGCLVQLSFSTPGSRVVTASFTDAQGLKGTDSRTVNVASPAPSKLIGSILSPQDGSAFFSRDVITLEWQAAGANAGLISDWTLTNTDSGETRPIAVTIVVPGQKATFRFVDVFPEQELSASTTHYDLTLKLSTFSGQTSAPLTVHLSQFPSLK